MANLIQSAQNVTLDVAPLTTMNDDNLRHMPHMPMSRLDTMPYGNLRFMVMQLIEIKDYLNTLPEYRQDFRGTVLRNPLTPPTGVARTNQTSTSQPEELQTICRKSILCAISRNK